MPLRRLMESYRPADGSKKKLMLSKNDERRTYAKLFEDAYNSSDPQKLLQFIQSYCTPDCVMIQRCVVNDNPFIPRYIEVHGSLTIHHYWCNIFVTIPDCLMVILETKLRIRKPTEDNRNDASFLVSSFSFTGTKLYSIAMEGAILEPPEGFDFTSTSGSSSSAAAVGGGSAKPKSVNDAQSVQALVAKAQQRSSRKRSLENASTESHSASSLSLTTQGGGGSSNSVSGSAGAVETVDKFNIFLHPPRKYSTLAGTRYGGNACHYIQSKNVIKPTVIAKVSDYVSINESTKLRTGEYIQTEGLINFLGTLTMTLNAEKKITKFEFLYSHMD
eukprot:scaffold5082_cov195-Ochromonas_danica.AAC.2